VTEIGIERSHEFILARQNGLLQFRQVVPALFQRRGTVAQEAAR
jgi:hypothetical protein